MNALSAMAYSRKMPLCYAILTTVTGRKQVICCALLNIDPVKKVK